MRIGVVTSKHVASHRTTHEKKRIARGPFHAPNGTTACSTIRNGFRAGFFHNCHPFLQLRLVGTMQGTHSAEQKQKDTETVSHPPAAATYRHHQRQSTQTNSVCMHHSQHTHTCASLSRCLRSCVASSSPDAPPSSEPAPASPPAPALAPAPSSSPPPSLPAEVDDSEPTPKAVCKATISSFKASTRAVPCGGQYSHVTHGHTNKSKKSKRSKQCNATPQPTTGSQW